jgi:hypothetical protein
MDCNVSKSEGGQSLLAALAENNIDFIVVGGVAAVLHGAPVVTQDLDIVHSRESENSIRLLTLLVQLEARYRGQPRGRVLRPSAEEIRGRWHLNLMTSLGPLDLLCEIADDEGYEELIGHTVLFSDGELKFAVLTLEKLIEIKKKTGRAKDRLALPLLIAALKMQSPKDKK